MFQVALLLLISMMVMWHINKIEDINSTITPQEVIVVTQHAPPPLPAPAPPPPPLELVLQEGHLVTIHDAASNKYLNVSNECADVAFKPTTMCLKWGEKAAYQYSSFMFYAPGSNKQNNIASCVSYILYSPYLNVWFSNNTEDNNLSSVSSTSTVKFHKLDNSNGSIRENTKYHIETSCNYFNKNELILTKINFDNTYI
jgi:hypothetical protein